MAIIAMIVPVENWLVFEVSAGFVIRLSREWLRLIDRCRAGISHRQRLPASITRAAIWRRQRHGFHSKGNSQSQSLAKVRRTEAVGHRSLKQLRR